MGAPHGHRKSWDGMERRSGEDRRKLEGTSPTGHERRKRPEPRQMTVVELFLSPEQWHIAQRRWFAAGHGNARNI